MTSHAQRTAASSAVDKNPGDELESCRFSEGVLRDATVYADQYRNADPFPFVVVDNFLDSSFADRLLSDFPVSAEAHKLNEFRTMGPKTVTRKMSSVSPAYQQLCDFMVSDEFVTFAETVTGIEGLISLPDEAGGAHENRNNSVLEPHLDYNYLGERSPLHRRLNMLLYLNKDWDPAWGGNFQLHSNPREWDKNQITTIEPIFNRCVIMETSEKSWHAFDKVRVPEGRSRKSISIYLFSKDRPAEEVAPRHTTIYVQRPISSRFQPGLTLSEADARELKKATEKRDNWIHFYQREALRQSAKAERFQKEAQRQERRADAQKGKANWLLGILREVDAHLEAGDVDAGRQRLEAYFRNHPDSRASSAPDPTDEDS